MIPNILAVNVFRRKNNRIRVLVVLRDSEHHLSLSVAQHLASKALETIVKVAMVGVLAASGESSTVVRFQFRSPFCLGLNTLYRELFSFHESCQG